MRSGEAGRPPGGTDENRRNRLGGDGAPRLRLQMKGQITKAARPRLGRGSPMTRPDYGVPEALARIEQRLERIEALLSQGPAAGQEWLSIKQTAQVTGLSQAHVRRAVRAGRLAASNVGTQAHPIWRI